MDLGEFKKHIKSFAKGTKFNFGISEPFSWRGVYAEVAFSIIELPMTREEILVNIELAYTGKFYGYKGGEYKYSDYTSIHFEDFISSYTDGSYVSEWIAKIEQKEAYKSQEERLVKTMFKK